MGISFAYFMVGAQPVSAESVRTIVLLLLRIGAGSSVRGASQGVLVGGEPVQASASAPQRFVFSLPVLALFTTTDHLQFEIERF